jgi:hypothetical protein
VLDFLLDRYASQLQPSAVELRAQRVVTAMLARLSPAPAAVALSQGSSQRALAATLGRNPLLAVFAFAGPDCFAACAGACRQWLLHARDETLWRGWWLALTRGAQPPAQITHLVIRSALVRYHNALRSSRCLTCFAGCTGRC